MAQRLQHKTRYTESDRREREESSPCHGKFFLNRTPIAQALRSTINKWNLMKLKIFCMANPVSKKKTLLYGKGHQHLDKTAAYRKGKDFYHSGESANFYNHCENQYGTCSRIWGFIKKHFILLQRHLFNHVHCCSIHSSQKLETT